MSDVNERIVQVYFELKGYMVTANHKYLIKKKSSSGESDIDLAIYRLDPPDKAIVEVKGWHTETFTLSYFKEGTGDYRERLLNFVKPEALKAAKTFFKTDKFRKILVVPELSPKQKPEIERLLKSKHDIDILEFTDVLKYVIDLTESNKNYGHSEFQQTIRLVKAYGFLKDY